MLNKHSNETGLISRRTLIIASGKLGLVFLLAGRMFYMQFIKKDQYKTLSDKNRIRIIAKTPVRGQISDINGRILAENRTCFQLFLEKSGNPQFQKDIELVANILELDSEQISQLKQKVSRAGYKVPAIIIDSLDWAEVSTIEERAADLPSLIVSTGYVRNYPYGSTCAHLVGYLGRSNSKEFVDESFRIGKSGIENYYDKNLRGKFGHKQIEVNAKGHFVRSLGSSAEEAGISLKTNIDLRLQEEAAKILSPQGASIVMMNCQTGQVHCLSSAPFFDPNQFSKLSQKYWQSLISSPYYPLINKAVQSIYPPGSLFKVVTILAALEDGHKAEERIYCNGGPYLGGNSFRCAKLSGHGALNLDEATKKSCNIYIYELAKRLGPEKIINMAKRLGFGSPTNIDIAGEKAGFVPTPEWKLKKFGQKWRLGDTLNLAIGQGYLLATTIQMANMMSIIASDGKIFTPRIKYCESQNNHRDIGIDKNVFTKIKKSLYKVVNEAGGTGYRSRMIFQQHRMSGKTGTAQVQAKKNALDNLSRADIAWQRRNHAIFGGFAPSAMPKYAICVYYDHGGGGGRSATPIARHIIQKAIEYDI